MVTQYGGAISDTLIKNLQEKSMEKRSQATRQVQTEIEELHAKGDMEQIRQRID